MPPLGSELEALKQWASSTPKKEFVRRIKGLGPRAYEQLLWYIEGKEAIKLDRHVIGFVDRIVGRPTSENEKIEALQAIARRLGISPTELDARIWFFMQARKAAESRSLRR